MRVDNPVDFAAQHEEAQIYLARAILLLRATWSRKYCANRNFVSAMNNISQISLLKGTSNKLSQ